MAVKIQDFNRKEVVVEESKFFYRILNGEEESQIYDDIMKVSQNGKKIDYHPGKLILRTVEAGLEGWEGVLDHEGKVLEFKKESVKFLPKEIRDKLYEVISQTKLTEEESKN